MTFFNWLQNKNWENLLRHHIDPEIAGKIMTNLEVEYQNKEIIYPEYSNILSVFQLLKPSQVKVVLLGQDPYHGAGQAHGLAFSVESGKIPPSLQNIMKEIKADIGKVGISVNGNLIPWAKQGVFLLNSVLTVQAGQPLSHQSIGWQHITDATIIALQKNFTRLVFLLWGKQAQKKKSLIDESKHLIIESSHPSPLSYYRGFKGHRQFSLVNSYLEKHGKSLINW